MSKLNQTEDSDPFELGGWNGEIATDAPPNRAGESFEGVTEARDTTVFTLEWSG